MRTKCISLLGVTNLNNIISCNNFFFKNDIDVKLVEQESCFLSLDFLEQKIVKCTDHLENAELYFVFNEFWLSVLLMKCKEGMSYNISYDALMASRSKKYFSDLLKKHGISSIERRYLQRGECVQSGSIVRPDSGYSGRGVKYFFDNTSFTDAFAAVSKDCSVNMKKILMHDDIDLVVEPYIDGEEYSCDVIISPLGIQIVRLCLKYITWIDGCPCTIAYLTLTPTEIMKKNIKEWCAAIFDDQDYSFAQLDFIQRMDKSLFLVDFSARTGGGLNMLLSKAAPKELYAIAICYALGKGNIIPRVEDHWAQYNIFSGMSEFAKCLITSNATTEYIPLPTSVESKSKSKCLISSINARIALIINHEASIDSFMQNCAKYKALLASEYCISTPQEDSSIVNSNNRYLFQSSIIDNKDAEKFLLSLEKHNISKDTCFLVQRLRNLPSGKLLDVGFGSGMLLRALLRSQFSLFGIEKSHVLYNNLNDSHPNANLFNDDLFNWKSCEKFEIIIFSFVLHHVKNPFDALKKFIPMLAANGYFFIVDRIAISDEDKCVFLSFWNNIYKNEHEWHEDCPIILTRKEYEKFFFARGFSVQFERYPHDIREGTEGFPKTLLIASR